MPATTGLIYVVDSSDEARIEDARDELHNILSDVELDPKAPLLVLANKQDLPTAMSAANICDKLALNSINGREWYIQGTCASSGDGLSEVTYIC